MTHHRHRKRKGLQFTELESPLFSWALLPLAVGRFTHKRAKANHGLALFPGGPHTTGDCGARSRPPTNSISVMTQFGHCPVISPHRRRHNLSFRAPRTPLQPRTDRRGGDTPPRGLLCSVVRCSTGPPALHRAVLTEREPDWSPPSGQISSSNLRH